MTFIYSHFKGVQGAIQTDLSIRYGGTNKIYYLVNFSTLIGHDETYHPAIAPVFPITLVIQKSSEAHFIGIGLI